MQLLFTVFAFSFAAVGCAALYLASPHQRWRRASLAARPAQATALLTLGFSLYAFTRTLSLTAAVSTFVAWTMLLLVVMPYLGALVARPAKGR